MWRQWILWYWHKPMHEASTLQAATAAAIRSAAVVLTELTEVRSTKLTEAVDAVTELLRAAEAVALRLPPSVGGGDGGAIDRADGADGHQQCGGDGAGSKPMHKATTLRAATVRWWR